MGTATVGQKRTPKQPRSTTLTPVERRILAVLADGKSHRREKLHALLPDDLGSVSNVRAHVSNLRRKLESRHQSIQCIRFRGRICYRLVDLLGRNVAS